MSILVLLSFVLASAVCGGVAWWGSARVERKTLKALVAVLALLLFVPVFYGGLVLMVRCTTTCRYDVNPADVPMLQPPASATDVCYVYSPAVGLILVVDFRVTEEEFNAWALKQGWQLEPVTAPESIRAVAREPMDGEKTWDVTITDGLRFDDYDKDRFDDSGTIVVYDRANGKGYIQRTAF